MEALHYNYAVMLNPEQKGLKMVTDAVRYQ